MERPDHRHAGIVHEHVDRGSRFEAPAERLDREGIAEVALKARCAQLGRGLAELRGVDVHERNGGASFDEALRDGPADARGRAGDQHVLPGEGLQWILTSRFEANHLGETGQSGTGGQPPPRSTR